MEQFLKREQQEGIHNDDCIVTANANEMYDGNENNQHQIISFSDAPNTNTTVIDSELKRTIWERYEKKDNGDRQDSTHDSDYDDQWEKKDVNQIKSDLQFQHIINVVEQSKKEENITFEYFVRRYRLGTLWASKLQENL